MHYFGPLVLEEMLKDPKTRQLEISLGYAWMIADITKADFDRKAAIDMQAKDANGDGKVSREEMFARFEEMSKRLKEKGIN